MKNPFRILTTSLGFGNLLLHFALIFLCHNHFTSESSGCSEPPYFKNMSFINFSMKGRLPKVKSDLPAGCHTVVGLLI